MATPRGSKTDESKRPVPVNAHRDLPMKRFYENADQDRLKMLLEFQEDPKFATLLGMMSDPEYAGMSFALMCRKCGVTLHQLNEIYMDADKQLALMNLSSALPLVAQDVAEDARSTSVECERCEGEGKIPIDPKKTDGVRVSDSGELSLPPTHKECPSCAGTGQIRKVGNKHARDLMFQSAGLTGKMQLAIGSQITLGGDMDAGIEQTLKLTQGILFKVGN